METLLRFQSSARPFVNGLQKNIARHLKYDQSNGAEEKVVEVVDESDIGQLPVEIRHNICSFLSADDLVHLSQVSYTWNITCNDEVHWKTVFDGEKIQWDSVQCYKPSDTMWQKFAKASSNVTELWAEDADGATQQTQDTLPKWKSTFILNRLANRPSIQKAASSADENVNLSSLNINSNLGDVAQAIKTNAPVFASKLASKISPVMGQLKVPFKKTYRIPMLGEGLESTSKDLLYSMMWPQNSPMFKVTGLYPGIEGIGSGVGFTIDDVNMNIAALHRCRLEDLRLKWRSYFQKADGVIYVVSCKNLHNKPARKQLKMIVSGEDPLVPSKVPLLVLLVCDDPLGFSFRPSEMADELKLYSLENRAWCVQLVDMSTLKGLPEGLRWLTTKV